MNALEKLIENALEELLNVKWIGDNPKVEEGKLVFPSTRDGKRRVSEQEARLLLVKQLEKTEQTEYQYAIEAPTSEVYSFTGSGSRSGNIDLCIYKNGKPFSLIEFKSKNPNQISYDHDFEKLFFDASGLVNYFIQILVNTDKRTLTIIEGKYCTAIDKLKDKEFPSSIRVYICDLGKKNIIRYEIGKDGNLTNNGTINCNQKN